MRIERIKVAPNTIMSPRIAEMTGNALTAGDFDLQHDLRLISRAKSGSACFKLCGHQVYV
jgi:hypothetical protein